MVGYSRLMGADEAGTIARLKAIRDQAIDPAIADHRGRIVKTTGDGLLAEFASAVEAVGCAVDIQRAIAEREPELSPDQRVAYRIGINIGDVVIDGDDILGDGVNVAARLEGLADPGNICISAKVYEEVRNKLDLGFADMGAQRVKNIAEPISCYRVLMADGDAGRTIPGKQPRRARRWAMGAAAAVILVAGALAWWQPWAPGIEPARMAKMAFPLPKKPSIVVLPFKNLTGDGKQDFLVDGLTENIIQALSKISELFVIARSSSFTYKGKPVQVQQVAEQMGVRYVLEGSFQKSGPRMRVTARLIDAVTGRHLWSERYDRNLTDLFAVQDDITRRIVVSLHVQLTEGEQARIRAKLTTNFTAWEQSQRALHHYRRYNKHDNQRALALAKASVKLDPKNLRGWTVIAWARWAEARFQFGDDPARSLKAAVEAANRALALDDKDTDALLLLGAVRLMRREFDSSVAVARKAVALSPNFADGVATLGFFLTYAGKPREAIGLMRRAMRLAPYHPSWYPLVLGRAFRMIRQYDKAIASIRTAVRRTPKSFLFHLELAAALSEAGRPQEARTAAARALTIYPKFTLGRWAKTIGFKEPAEQRRFLEALRKAGLPE